MQSLDDAYDRRLGGRESDERLLLGYGLVALGGFLVFAGGVVGVSSAVGDLFGLAIDWERWGAGAMLAGVGLPLAFTGVFTVAPMPGRERAVAAAGVLLSFAGVAFFDYAYPSRWQGDPLDLSGLVFLVYTAGAAVMFYSLFRSVLEVEIALPRSKLSLSYTEEKVEPRRFEEAVDDAEADGFGGVGISMDVEGGTDAELLKKTPDEEPDEPVDGFAGDRYCGNCRFYDFTESDDGATVPYCQYHDEPLHDLEACDAHEMRVTAEAAEASD